MDLFRFNMALGTSLLNYNRLYKPYINDHIFTDYDTEYFLRSLTWETELKEFSEVDTLILRRKGDERILYTILKRKDKGFTIKRVIQAIRKCFPDTTIPFDITNIELFRNKNKLYIKYNLIT